MENQDILLDESGDIRLNEYEDATLTGSVIQDINVHLRWFLAEWPFDESMGVDWFGDVFVKNPDTDQISRMIRSEIAGINGIQSVEEVTVQVDNATRTAVIQWAAKTTEEVLKSEVKLWANMASQKMALY